MKKNYMKPITQVVKVQQQHHLMDLSLQNNAGLRMGGASTSSTDVDRSRSVGDWDDE